MNSIKSRVAYLSGLIDGLELEKQSKEGKIIKEMVDILKYIGEEFEEIKESHKEIEEYVDVLDEDLSMIEDEIYDEAYDNDDDDFDEEDIENFVNLKCPNCNETLYIDAGIMHSKDKILCPNCRKDIEIDVDCNCDHCE